MKKKKINKKKRVKDSSGNLEAQINQLQQTLAAKRPRKSLALAKQLLKRADFPADKTDLLCHAHLLRVCQLAGDNHLKEAKVMLLSVESNPLWTNHLPSGEHLHAALVCGLSHSWIDQYENDPASREAMDHFILHSLNDLRVVAENDSISQHHPLKVEACSCLEAWKKIDNHEPDEIVSGPLREISRHSPFRYWRLFLQAMQAYLKNDDLTLAQNLKRIPEDCSLYSLAAKLMKLTTGSLKDFDPLDPIAKSIVATGLKSRLEKVDALIKKDNQKAVKKQIDALFDDLYPNKRQQFSCEIAANISFRFYGSEVDRYDLRQNVFLKNPFTALRWANLAQRPDMVFAMAKKIWKKHGDDLSDLERAILLQRMAANWLSVHEFWAPQEKSSPPGWNTRDLNKVEDEYLPEQTTWPERFSIIEKYGILSFNTFPLKDTCRILVRMASHASDIRKKRTYLLQWHTAFPEDAEALDLLVRECRKDGSPEEALQFLDQLISLKGRSPDLLNRQSLAYAEWALQALNEGDSAGVHVRLKECATTVLHSQVLADIIRWKEGGDSRKEKIVLGAALATYNQPAMILHFCRVIDRGFQKARLPAGIKRQLEQPEILLQSLTALTELEDPIWSVTDDHSIRLLCHGGPDFSREKIDEQVLRKNFVRLLNAALRLKIRYLAESLLKITIRGLNAPKENIPLFLIFRGFIYHYFHQKREQQHLIYLNLAKDCLVLAAYHSQASSDLAKELHALSVAVLCPDFREMADKLKKGEIKQQLKKEKDISSLADILGLSYRSGFPSFPFGFNDDDDDDFPFPFDFDDDDDDDDDQSYDSNRMKDLFCEVVEDMIEEGCDPSIIINISPKDIMDMEKRIQILSNITNPARMPPRLLELLAPIIILDPTNEEGIFKAMMRFLIEEKTGILKRSRSPKKKIKKKKKRR